EFRRVRFRSSLPMKNEGVARTPARDAFSRSASMSGSILCAETQDRGAVMSTPPDAATCASAEPGSGKAAHFSCDAKSASWICQNLSCAAAHMAYSAAGIAFWCELIGKLTKASRTLPLSMYSRRIVRSDESCHILQCGHWKSLARINQTFAAGLPRMRALSACATSGSVEAEPPVCVVAEI